MARAVFCAAAVLLLCAAVAQARILEAEEGAGRSLLQISAQQCKTKTNLACASCSNRRIPGSKKTEMVCARCETGFRLRKDGKSKTCDCAPGLYLNATLEASGWCVPCPQGQYCLGGGAKATDSPATACPTGLATKFAGAKSQQQCFTTPGYGRVVVKLPGGSTTLNGSLCDAGTYNIGGNTAGCQKCGPGLTTQQAGSSNSTQCVAPAGSYNDKGVGKKCQKGTYTTDFNSAAFCTACADGVTTAAEGSSASEACAFAIKGFYMVNATNAEPCDYNFYNDVELAAGQTCTPCPFAWKTRDTGADGLALCLAPPGYEQATAGADITKCTDAHYKADWNRNPCDSCGAGLKTNDTGSISKDACLVPAGSGLTSISPLAASPCVKSSYGVDVDRAAVANARCASCALNMFTLDDINATLAPAAGYTSELDCLVKPGWGTTASIVEQCKVGTYNAGYNREPCKACIAGMTTLSEGATTIADCVIQPGWAMDTVLSIPKPCDKGSYSTGGTLVAPNATCESCPTGFTTQEQEAEASTECAVCSAGYGGASCTGCAYGTFSYGGTADNCVACADGSTSRRRATEVNMCFSALVDAVKDIFDGSAYAASTNVDASTCATSCKDDATCIAFKHTSGACSLVKIDAAATSAMAFKVNGGVDYAVYPVTGTLGASLGAASSKTWAECAAACSANGACEAVNYEVDGSGVPKTGSNSCELFTSELAADFTGMFAVRASKLYSDLTLA